MNAFLIALHFLTRIHISNALNYSEKELGRSALWYPFVGLLIGIFLALCSIGFSALHLSSFVVATLLMSVWILITGALHWDGLADSADAWLAGGDKEKTLIVLKDTHCGAAAIIVVGISLLVFCAALEQVVEKRTMEVILLAPLLARSAGLLLLLTTPYVRKDGLGETLAQHASLRWSIVILLIVIFSTVFLLKWQSAIVLAGLSVLFLLLRRLMLLRIGGITGDTIGALIVLSEIAVILLSVIGFN
jgi:adenosylcobinamide-GDP ribazoletransferase